MSYMDIAAAEGAEVLTGGKVEALEGILLRVLYSANPT